MTKQKNSFISISEKDNFKKKISARTSVMSAKKEQEDYSCYNSKYLIFRARTTTFPREGITPRAFWHYFWLITGKWNKQQKGKKDTQQKFQLQDNLLTF